MVSMQHTPHPGYDGLQQTMGPRLIGAAAGGNKPGWGFLAGLCCLWDARANRGRKTVWKPERVTARASGGAVTAGETATHKGSDNRVSRQRG